MFFFYFIICVALANYGVTKIDCRLVSDDDDVSTAEDDLELSMLKRAGSAATAIKGIQDLPPKEIMEISVSKFDANLKRDFQKVYESLDKDDRETIEFTFALLTLKSLNNCASLKKPYEAGEKQFNSAISRLMQLAFKLVFWGSDKNSKEILKKAQKQIEANSAILCNEVGK